METDNNSTKCDSKGSSESNKITDLTPESGQVVVGDENDVQLRKQSRSKLVMRNRKQPMPANIIQNLSTNNPTSSQGRSRSLTWYRTPSILQPPFSSNPFTKRLSRQHKKWSAPITLSSSYRRSKR